MVNIQRDIVKLKEYKIIGATQSKPHANPPPSIHLAGVEEKWGS